MNILVTGANGQLGMELRSGSASGPNRFVFTDKAASDGTQALDVTDADAVMQAVVGSGAQVIVNCAAYTNVDRAEEEPEAASAVNCTAAGNLARAASATGATLIHISTDYVFDGGLRRPYTETDSPAPLSVYGRTKLAGERAIEASGCKWLIFRTSGLYSPYGGNFVKTIRRLLSERVGIKVVDDQICTPTYAKDLACLIVKIIDQGLYDRTGLYNFSGEGRCSWYEFARAVAELSTTSGAVPDAAVNVSMNSSSLAASANTTVPAASANTAVPNPAATGEAVKPRQICSISPCSSAEYPSKAVRPAWSVLDKTKVMRTFGLAIPPWRLSLEECIFRMDGLKERSVVK